MLVIRPSPISELLHALLPPKVLRAKECATTSNSSIVFTLESHLSLSRNLGVGHKS